MIHLKQLKIFLLFFLFIFEYGFTQTQIQKDSLLLEAVKTNNLEYVKNLIKQGANVNLKDEYGESLLHYILYNRVFIP